MPNNICRFKYLLYTSTIAYGIWMLSCKTKSMTENQKSIEVETSDTTTSQVIGDTIKGKFVYMADAAIFTYCVSGDKIPVAMEANYIEAERAYTSSNHKDMEGLYMKIIGLVEDRNNGEGKTIPHVIINKLLSSDINGKCE
jgi:copper homeostasis protein (lipoprotein)